MPNFDVPFAGETRVKVHKDSSASFPCLKRSTGIEPRATPLRKFGTRGTPSKFVLYTRKNICAKFGSCTRFVTIIPLSDRTNRTDLLCNDQSGSEFWVQNGVKLQQSCADF